MRKYDNAFFWTKLKETLIRVESHDCKCFEQVFLSFFNLHAPMKSKNKNKKQNASCKFYDENSLQSKYETILVSLQIS